MCKIAGVALSVNCQPTVHRTFTSERNGICYVIIGGTVHDDQTVWIKQQVVGWVTKRASLWADVRQCILYKAPGPFPSFLHTSTFQKKKKKKKKAAE